MLSILFLGFFIGLQHALEADHVAAVASLSSRSRSLRSMIWHGAMWGVGHTLTLLLVGGAFLVLGRAISGEVSNYLEMAVGVMLVLLGGDVLRRLIRDRIHFHLHKHEDGARHLHAHSHAGEAAPHDPARHDHDHFQAIHWRTLAVGMVHGLAGSAALVVLVAAAVDSPWGGLGYILLFGLGSILGMAALTAVMTVPLTYADRYLTWGQRAVQGAVGSVTVFVGLWIVYETALAA